MFSTASRSYSALSASRCRWNGVSPKIMARARSHSGRRVLGKPPTVQSAAYRRKPAVQYCASAQQQRSPATGHVHHAAMGVDCSDDPCASFYAQTASSYLEPTATVLAAVSFVPATADSPFRVVCNCKPFSHCNMPWLWGQCSFIKATRQIGSL